MDIHKRLYIELPYDPPIPLLGIYLDKTFLKKDTCTCMFIAALFTISQDMGTIQMSIRKMLYIYTTEYYSAIKKNKIMPICSNMDGTRDSHTE